MRLSALAIAVILLLSVAYADTYVDTNMIAIQKNPYDLEQIVQGAYQNTQASAYDNEQVAQVSYVDTQAHPVIHVDTNIAPTTDGRYRISWHVWIEGEFSGHPYYIMVYRDDTGEVIYTNTTTESTRSVTLDTPEVTIIVNYGGMDMGPKVPPKQFFVFQSNMLPMVVKKAGRYRFTMLGYTTSDVNLDFGDEIYAVIAQTGGGLFIHVEEVD